MKIKNVALAINKLISAKITTSTNKIKQKAIQNYLKNPDKTSF